MPSLHHAVFGAFGGDREAGELAREAGGKRADVDHFLDFATAFGEKFAGLDGHEAPEGIDVGTEFLAEQADEFTAFWRRDVAPFEEGRVGLGDAFGGFGRGNDGELGDDFTGKGSPDGEAITGVCAGWDIEFGEDCFDFVFEGHGWHLVSVEVAGVSGKRMEVATYTALGQSTRNRRFRSIFLGNSL